MDVTVAGIRRARAAFPILRAIVDTAGSFEREITDIRRKIDPQAKSSTRRAPS